MRVIALKTLRDFSLAHPDAGPALSAWAQEARTASWKTPQDIKRRYAHASFLEQNRVVFNIKGNAVYVKFVGTHAQYDAIDAATIEMD